MNDVQLCRLRPSYRALSGVLGAVDMELGAQLRSVNANMQFGIGLGLNRRLSGPRYSTILPKRASTAARETKGVGFLIYIPFVLALVVAIISPSQAMQSGGAKMHTWGPMVMIVHN